MWLILSHHYELTGDASTSQNLCWSHLVAVIDLGATLIALWRAKRDSAGWSGRPVCGRTAASSATPGGTGCPTPATRAIMRARAARRKPATLAVSWLRAFQVATCNLWTALAVATNHHHGRPAGGTNKPVGQCLYYCYFYLSLIQ